MYFDESPERSMLGESARAYLEDRSSSARVRALAESDEPLDLEMWKEMCAMGWSSVAIPEAYGGAGFGPRELGVLVSELGRALTPTPLLSSVVLGARIIELAGSEEQKREYLPAIGSGELVVSVAMAEPDAGWDPGAVAATASPADGGSVTGRKSFVLDAQFADLLVIPAAENGDLSLYLVAAGGAGVRIEPLPTMDLTRPQADVHLDAAGTVARLGNGGGGRELLRRLLDEAVAMMSFEQVGGAERCMEMSVAYAKERMQFGRPIGSFQAIKHKCAQMLVDVESARSTALYAAKMIEEGSPDVGVAAALAKVRCSDAFFDVASETIQVHGGIGFTWEHDAHLYFKRAKTDRLLFGDPAEWRARLGDRLDL